MSNSTRATMMLARAGVSFGLHSYRYDPEAAQIGLQAAEALAVPPTIVLKTLMATVGDKPVCALIPSDRELSIKRLAAAFGARAACMMRAADAERVSGYVVGGISPFGQRRHVPAAIEEQALCHPAVFINAGQRGLQLSLSPSDAQRSLGAISAPLVA